MSVKFLEGEDGSKLKVLEQDGFSIPTFPFPTHAQEYATLPTWKARDDDLLICAYPKSGTHWLWEVVSMLKQQKAERIDAIKEWNMLEGIQQANFDSLPSPRIMNTHIYFRHLPKDFKNRKCKILYMLRNPKDVAVSYYNHHSKVLEYEYSGSWEHYFTRYLKGDVDYGSWFEYTLDWERVMEDNPEYPIHTLHYESMKQNSLNEIKRIAKFLEIEATDDLVQKIDDLCSFEKMKKEKNKHEDVNEWKDKEPGMYRKGQVGDWKNWFTVAQDDLFDKFYKEKMSKSKVKMQFSV
ncbi:sulfotransferase 1B1-like [Mytilus trossulus]|uniref:sulfotransferase 1B1-like n=1 Tax=Mytilus trossulus TaxID=6551 RepID=UPI003005AA5D